MTNTPDKAPFDGYFTPLERIYHSFSIPEMVARHRAEMRTILDVHFAELDDPRRAQEALEAARKRLATYSARASA